MKTLLNLFFLPATLLTFLLSVSMLSASNVTDTLLQEYQAQGANIFSAEAGKALWVKDSNGRSCTSCHLSFVKEKGKHKRTGKVIQAMAPSINPQRLTDAKKIKKWFLRNCKWTFLRECTAQEKGDILLWLSLQ